MEGRFNDLEFEFIMETLDLHGEFLSDILTETIEQKKLIDEGNLESGIDFHTLKYGINPALVFEFPDYGRFIEINYHKKRSANTGSWTEMAADANRAIWGQNKKKIQRRKKDTRWYAKNVYGSINRLIGILMNEFTDEEKDRLKALLERRNTVAA